LRDNDHDRITPRGAQNLIGPCDQRAAQQESELLWWATAILLRTLAAAAGNKDGCR
jgi:hypothetical protein